MPVMAFGILTDGVRVFFVAKMRDEQRRLLPIGGTNIDKDDLQFLTRHLTRLFGQEPALAQFNYLGGENQHFLGRPSNAYEIEMPASTLDKAKALGLIFTPEEGEITSIAQWILDLRTSSRGPSG